MGDSAAFSVLRITKFPVFFPVSRDFSRRRVSARLPAPPCSLECRENQLHPSRNRWISAQFSDLSRQSGPEKLSDLTTGANPTAFFSRGHICSPVSTSHAFEK